jgi:hypothetical protein
VDRYNTLSGLGKAKSEPKRGCPAASPLCCDVLAPGGTLFCTRGPVSNQAGTDAIQRKGVSTGLGLRGESTVWPVAARGNQLLPYIIITMGTSGCCVLRVPPFRVPRWANISATECIGIFGFGSRFGFADFTRRLGHRDVSTFHLVFPSNFPPCEAPGRRTT